MKSNRAPRSKKRVSCDLGIGGSRYKGIVLDVSVSGLFVQTTVKPEAGARVEVALTLPGVKEPVVFDARVARKKAVPAALLTAAGGGVGLAIDNPPQAYLDFISDVSPTQAAYVATEKSRQGASEAGRLGAVAKIEDSPVDPGSAAKHFRIHAVDIKTGQRNTYVASSASEGEASALVLDQLGEEWQVIFVERV